MHTRLSNTGKMFCCAFAIGLATLVNYELIKHDKSPQFLERVRADREYFLSRREVNRNRTSDRFYGVNEEKYLLSTNGLGVEGTERK